VTRSKEDFESEGPDRYNIAIIYIPVNGDLRIRPQGVTNTELVALINDLPLVVGVSVHNCLGAGFLSQFASSRDVVSVCVGVYDVGESNAQLARQKFDPGNVLDVWIDDTCHVVGFVGNNIRECSGTIVGADLVDEHYWPPVMMVWYIRLSSNTRNGR
jgi:hypothetical protein